jgi:hypothetical protein
VFSPGPLLDPDNYGAPALAWLAALLTAAPATAYLMNRRQPVVTTEGVGLWTGIPQLPLMLLLVRLDVWKDVRSGYYVAWSGEKQTAYGIGPSWLLLSVWSSPLWWPVPRRPVLEVEGERANGRIGVALSHR